MSHPEVLRADPVDQPIRNPWPLLGTGMLLAAISFAIPSVASSTPVSVRVALAVLGALALGIAVAIRPKSWAVLLLATVGTALAAAGVPVIRLTPPALPDPGASWDSLRLLLGFLALVGLLATVLMALPRTYRRALVSLLVVLHFGGIVTAIMQVPPAPWIMGYLFTQVYRPYLQFMYLTNAYHFYAPEPGPGILLWFQVKYEDGAEAWVKLPRREDYPLTLQYQRRLALVEQINQAIPFNQIPRPVVEARLLAARVHRIPYHPDVPDALQYREPNPFAKKMLSDYARHVASNTPHPSGEPKQVSGVRIYRIVHSILSAPEIAKKTDPTSKWLYLPYYQGDYDAQGNLKNPADPYLYWLIPILRKDAYHNAFANENPDVEDTDRDVYDFFQKHVKMEPLVAAPGPEAVGPPK